MRLLVGLCTPCDGQFVLYNYLVSHLVCLLYISVKLTLICFHICFTGIISVLGVSWLHHATWLRLPRWVIATAPWPTQGGQRMLWHRARASGKK